MSSEQQSNSLTIAEDQSKQHAQNQPAKRVRHVYLQQQNIYGRFVPYLLLKDQLQSEIDSSGNTALHHMCSHNSPYIPLFLSTIPDGDPILNRKSKLGHTPLDVAGLYCSKQYVEMLKAKGAIDNGNVDYWAIQGANPSNWSGKIYPDKKQLIHWAAYNDLPQVIAEYAKQGVNISQPDSNGYTPIDLTVLNKSYNSMRVLTELGERPKSDILKTCDSKSIKQHMARLHEGAISKSIKQVLKVVSLIGLLVASIAICDFHKVSMSLMGVALMIMIHIMIKPTPTDRYMDQNRKSQFVSELFLYKIINRRNHFSYLLLHVAIATLGIFSLYNAIVFNHFLALLCIYVTGGTIAYSVHLFAQLYGICKNLTYDQLFYAYKWSHLWEKVKYIEQRKFVVREFVNNEDKGLWQNIKDYFNFS